MVDEKKNTIVMKFGGTSVQDAAAIRQVIQIVRDTRRNDGVNVVLVVSALAGATNQLQEGILRAAGGDRTTHHEIAETLKTRHIKAARDLLAEADGVIDAIRALIDEYVRFGDSVHVLGEATPRVLDFTMGLGERMSTQLIAAALAAAGIASEPVEATRLIITDDQFQNAAPLMDETEISVGRVLGPLLADDISPVVTGFIGATVDGVITTLGRGGSDYSASIIGACLPASEVWIWTDVDGVMSADPRIVPEAQTINRLSHAEVGELAYFGAKVLHPRTIRPVLEAGIPVRVKNTFNPTHPGTLVEADGSESAFPIKAVTAIRDMSLITVTGKGMLGVPGIAARTFGAVAQTGTSVLLISQSSSEQSICFAIPDSASAAVQEAINDAFVLEITRRDIDAVHVEEDISIITVVGAGMVRTPGIAGRVFTATGDHNVNVIAIAQGSSEYGISLVVDADDADRALRAIHDLIIAN